MFKNISHYSFLLFTFIFLSVTNLCLADIATGLEQAKGNVISLIDSEEWTSAQLAISQMKVDFAGNNDLADHLLHFAWISEQRGQRGFARALYQDISQNYSEGDLDRAAFANMWISRFDIYNLVDTSDYAAVESSIEQMKVNFAGNKDLADHLYNVAWKCRESDRKDVARALYQDISQNYSEIDPYITTLASIWISRLNINDLIDAGDYAAAETSITQMKVDFAKSEDLADSLLHFAWRCEQRGQRDISRVWYRDVSQNYSEIDPYRSSTAAMHIAIIDVDICKLVDMNDMAAVEAAITHLKSEFSSTHKPSFVMYVLAKVLRRKASMISADGQDDTDRVRDYMKQAIAIYENEVIGKTDRADIGSEAYRVSARSYGSLGDYAKSVEYYQQSVDKYPKDHLSWHAQSMVGHTYEQMLKAGQISKSEAVPLITNAYTNLLKNYPNCKAAKIAKYWLSSH